MGYWEPAWKGGHWRWVENGPKGGEPPNLWGHTYEQITDHAHPPTDSAPVNWPGPQLPPPDEIPKPPWWGPQPKGDEAVLLDVEVPTLAMQGGWPPAITGQLAAAPPDRQVVKDKPDPDPPDNAVYSILPSSLREAQQMMLAPVGVAIDSWDELKAYWDSVKDYVFYRPKNNTTHAPPTYDDMQMRALVSTTLLQAADAAMIVGRACRLLNSAGQIYVNAELQCEVPADWTLVIGPPPVPPAYAYPSDYQGPKPMW